MFLNESVMICKKRTINERFQLTSNFLYDVLLMNVNALNFKGLLLATFSN